jgi:hypothetical protein
MVKVKKAEVVVTTPKEKAPTISLKAMFEAKNEKGNWVEKVYTSKAGSVKQALLDLKDEQGFEYPKGLSCLVHVTLTNGEKTLERAISPTNGRLILEGKDEEGLRAIFRGLI